MLYLGLNAQIVIMTPKNPSFKSSKSVRFTCYLRTSCISVASSAPDWSGQHHSNPQAPQSHPGTFKYAVRLQRRQHQSESMH